MKRRRARTKGKRRAAPGKAVRPRLHLTGRQIDITDPIRAYTESRIAKLGRFIDGITEVHATLSVEKYRHIAEVNVHSRRHRHLTAVEESNDLYLSIAQAVDKLAAQAKKLQARRRTQKRRPGRREETASGPPPAEAAPEDGGLRIVETSRLPLKPLSVEEAVAELAAGRGEFLVFRNATFDRMNVVYRRRDGNYGLIDPEP
jgi:putative sigma-54 modulation protein